jgi:hypothetical protein
MIQPVQEDFNVWAALTGRIAEGALAPVVETVQRRLDMLAGAQAVDAVVGAVATVDGFRKRANLYTISLSAIGADLVVTEKIIAPRLGLDMEAFILWRLGSVLIGLPDQLKPWPVWSTFMLSSSTHCGSIKYY